jgi:hypothetical protein
MAGTQLTTFPDYLSELQEKVGKLERRPAPMSASDLLGPGAASQAVQIADWNHPSLATNGNYYSLPGALHSPDALLTWTGTVIAKDNGSGMQEVWNTDDLDAVQYWMRTYVGDGTGQGYTFTSWRNFATESGYIDFEHINPDYTDSVQDQLDDLAADIVGITPTSLLVYRQDTAPTDPELGRDLQVGDQWIDTNDDNHPYIWDGTIWADYADYVLGDIPAQIAAAQAAAEAAADAAADSFDIATAKNRVFRQDTAPTNPVGGYALNTGDVWFDDNDNDKPYTWSGSAWVLTDIANYAYVDTAEADAIATAAADATTKAAAAQTAATAVANTKNTIFRQDGIPTSLAVGDIWFDTNDSNKIYQSKMIGADAITAGEWEALLVGTAAIADDAITSAKIFAGTIVTTDLAATAIDGMTITGATIQTIVTAARGIKINSTGLTAYNGSGVATLTIVGATGAITMLGDLTSGSTITGATVTGGTLQTSASASTGIKITTSGLTAYGSGSPVLTISATTGAITAAGPIFTAADISGSTITGGTIQTSASANTGIKITTTGMVGYGGGGAKFTVSATTGNVILAGDMTGGGVIVGPIFKTDEDFSQGVEIDSTGLVAWNAFETPSVVIDGATGNMTLTGTAAAMAIDGAVVTGGTVQTSGTALTGVKMTSAGIVAYGSGSAKFTVDGTTGDVILAGAMTGAGTITGPVFQTSSSGQRFVIDGPGDIIYFYSGLASETPGNFDPQVIGGAPAVLIETGTTATYSDQPSMYLVSGDPGVSFSSFNVQASQTFLSSSGATINILDPGDIEIHQGGGDNLDLGVSGSSTATVTMAGIGVGTGFDTQQDAPSGNTSPTGTTNSTVAGLSITVTSVGTGSVFLVTIDGDVTFTGAGTNIIELLVDGTPEAVQLLSFGAASGARQNGSKTWRITGLSAGSHTFTARTRHSAAVSVSTVTAAHTLMTTRHAQ